MENEPVCSSVQYVRERPIALPSGNEAASLVRRRRQGLPTRGDCVTLGASKS